MNLYFDIETGPRPDAGQFAPTEWPIGNAKDPAKVAEIVAAKKAAWLEDAALSAITGQVVAVGYMRHTAGTDGQCVTLDSISTPNEAELVEAILDEAHEALRNGGLVFGFNIIGFDLPFLAQRAYALGLRVSPLLGGYNGRFWSWHDNIIDLQQVWLAGQRDFSGHSLDNILRCCGLPPKLGNGAHFADLLKTDREAAIAYLRRDVEAVRELAERMGY